MRFSFWRLAGTTHGWLDVRCRVIRIHVGSPHRKYLLARTADGNGWFVRRHRWGIWGWRAR